MLISEILKFADKLHEAQLAYLHNQSEATASDLRRATHAYAKARANISMPEEVSLADVKARVIALELDRPLSAQEVALAINAIDFTYDDLLKRLKGNEYGEQD